MQKECFKCHQMLDISEFYKHPRMADGHLNKCKKCAKKDVSQNYDSRRDQYAEYERERCQRPERKAKALHYQQKRRHKYPHKDAARRAVNDAIRYGRLQKKPCQFCGNQKSQAHHDDYSKPLDVIWACFKCHREKLHGQVVVSDYGQAAAQPPF